MKHSFSVSADNQQIDFNIVVEEFKSVLQEAIRENFSQKAVDDWSHHRDIKFQPDPSKPPISLSFKYLVRAKPSLTFNDQLSGVSEVTVKASCEGDPARVQAFGISKEKIGKFDFDITILGEIGGVFSLKENIPLVIKKPTAELQKEPSMQAMGFLPKTHATAENQTVKNIKEYVATQLRDATLKAGKEVFQKYVEEIFNEANLSISDFASSGKVDISSAHNGLWTVKINRSAPEPTPVTENSNRNDRNNQLRADSPPPAYEQRPASPIS